MSEAPPVSLEAKSPYELRVHLGDAVLGAERPRGARHRRHGVPPFVYDRFDRGWARRAGRGLDDGLHVALPVLPQPGHLDASATAFRCRLTKAAETLGNYRHGLKIMSGGFTLSGGEPLMQHRFAAKLLAAAKKMGIHTTIETNGFYGERLSDAEIDTIDLVMLGLKTWDPARHRALTGQDVGPTLAFARRLAARRRPIWIRFVLVPGLTDDMDDLAKTAEFAAGLGNVERVEVLPFHQLGRFKWERLGLDYKLRDVAPPTPELTERACEVLRKAGLKAY